MRLMWTDFRRSPLFLLAIPLMALEPIAMWYAAGDWQGMWTSASVAVCWPMVVIAPILAGSTCHAAVSWSRKGAAVMANSARPRWHDQVAMLLPALFVAGATLLAGLVLAHVTTWPIAHHGPGWLRLGLPLVSLSFLAIAIGLGHLAGHLASSWWMPPAVAMSVLALAVTLSRPGGLVFMPLLAPVGMRLVPAAVLLPVAAAAVVLVTATTGLHNWDRVVGRPARRRWVLGAGLIATAVVLGTATTVPLYLPRTDVVEPLCTDEGAPQLCIYPEAVKYLPVVSAIGQRVRDLPTGLFEVPPQMFQQGLRPEGGFGYQAGPWQIASGVAGTILFESELYCDADDIGPQRRERAAIENASVREWLTLRLYGRPRPDGLYTTFDPLLDLEEIADVTRRPEDDQVQWVNERLRAMWVACGLG